MAVGGPHGSTACTLSLMARSLKETFEVHWHPVDTGYSDTLGVNLSSVIAGGPLSTPHDSAGGDLEFDIAVVIILAGVGASVAANGVHVLGVPVNKGVGGLAGGVSHRSPLHHEVAIAAGVQVRAGLRVVDMLPHELLITGFPLAKAW